MEKIIDLYVLVNLIYIFANILTEFDYNVLANIEEKGLTVGNLLLFILFAPMCIIQLSFMALGIVVFAIAFVLFILPSMLLSYIFIDDLDKPVLNKCIENIIVKPMLLINSKIIKPIVKLLNFKIVGHRRQ